MSEKKNEWQPQPKKSWNVEGHGPQMAPPNAGYSDYIAPMTLCFVNPSSITGYSSLPFIQPHDSLSTKNNIPASEQENNESDEEDLEKWSSLLFLESNSL